MDSYVDKTTKNIPDTLKQSIGKLIVVNAGETDPARKIHYASSLITHIRSALFDLANNAENRSFTEVLHVMLYNILKSEFDLKALQFAFNRIEKLFEDKPRVYYDAMLMNDIALLQSCRNNWRKANRDYFENQDAWMSSNEILADIQDTLVEIAVRWNLIIIPKEMSFNISQIPNLGIPQAESHTPLDE
jgi:hypothetical protein